MCTSSLETSNIAKEILRLLNFHEGPWPYSMVVGYFICIKLVSVFCFCGADSLPGYIPFFKIDGTELNWNIMV